VKHILIVLILFTGVFISSCKKEGFDNGNAGFSLSTDTLHFDTVFTSAGSVTQFFLLKNNSGNDLLIDGIELMGGNASPFNMNVDGLPGSRFSNLIIEGNDSLYVFVSVNVNPQTEVLPFIIRDSIQISANGKKVFQQLEAWGQNARYIRNQLIRSNTIWDNKLPYVILGGVLIDTLATLQIEPGTRIYLNADAPLVVDGTLLAKGTKKDSIVFQGNRLDEPYRNFPGAWPGIIFRGSSQKNQLEHVFIKNAYQGIVLDQHEAAEPKVVLNNCVLDNIYETGLLAINSRLQANNCLISNCGNNISLLYGGDYEFNHCTVVSLSTNYITHNKPACYAANFIKQNNRIFSAPLNVSFVNSIVWGSEGIVEKEIVVEKEGAEAVDVHLDHVLFRTKADPANTRFTNVIRNENPVFDSTDVAARFFNFRLKKESPAINKGKPNVLPLDLDGKLRDAQPDLGCYETP
jgi:hypothetical protein